MPKVYQFTNKDKKGNIKNAGRMEIKNQTENSADLYFYGDIVSIAYNADDWWSWGNPEDRAPQDVSDFLNELDGMTDVNIHINSGGGDVFAGIAIYNILKNNTAKKTAYVEGLAASSASLIPFACDTVIIPSSAQLMIHNPWTVAMGNANDFRKMADTLDQIAQSLINIYMENAKEGVTEEQFKQMMDAETWMTGNQAAEYFNIQIDETEAVAACASSDFFSKYKNTPQNLIKEEAKSAKNTQNSNNEVLKALKNIENRLDKLENSNINTNSSENEELENKKVNNLKAKLALKCRL
jgi:ATP-dependent Clp protease protease subunit